MRISDWSSDVCSSDLRPSAVKRTSWLSGGAARRWPAASATEAVRPGGDFTACPRIALIRGWLPPLECVRLYDLEAGLAGFIEIGRASCRDSVCPDVWISVVAVSLKKKNNRTNC